LSSRRRHTRCYRDWSSDVCSSDLGVNRTIQVARRLGITSPLNTDLTMALGSSDLTLLELTSAYSALANQGTWVPPTTIRYVTDRSEERRVGKECKPRRERETRTRT